ncbi:flagellar biosynthetic protein FliR [Pengzhenrongella sicca]|uniref:Flagellar biosynthetic protein FliR n=1 Tax=Pengzhenrongella sicca TaxID=2819238 RepID=A0A8A4ZD91_9MICO|nr:flagellar biosynthetic protein FliR [Pengzhenrongella sicca]QTE29884.1 flagellar biosynthetic protein FliR [Pengzhenrongella sicca]
MTLTLPWAGLEATLLAGVRIAAFLVIAPPFSHRGIPGTVKALLALAIGLIVAPRASASSDPTDVAGFAGQLLLQVLIGAALGFLVAMALSVVQAAGGLIDMFGGFQMNAAYDPMMLTNSATFARLYQFTALVLLFASDGYQVVLIGIVRTFDVLPLGMPLDLAAMAATSAAGLTEMFLAALQVAGPLVVVLFLADVGLGLLTRVAPALNAFALGFPLKILMTLLLAGTAFLALPQLVSTLVDGAMTSVLEVAR